MHHQFLQILQSFVPNVSSTRFLLAVSGGQDSVVMAHLFAKNRLHFDIAHCNFHLRGEESNVEMEFVKHLPFLTTQKVFVKEFDTLSIQQQSEDSIEMVARKLRYKWFEEMGKDYDYIVTAHHANDNAETVLLNMLRGTGLRGMCGIPQKNGKIIRPLLRFGRKDIEKYCHEQRLDFCFDSSNSSDLFLRNRIRRYIIPELEKMSPICVDTFSKNSDIFVQQTKFFDAHIQQYKNKIGYETEDRITIDIDALKNIEYPSLVLFEILYLYGFNAVEVENILKSVNAKSGRRFLSNTHILIKDRTHFILEKNKIEKEEKMTLHSILDIEKYGFTVERSLYSQNFTTSKDSNVIYVDANKLTFPLTIKNWEKGDYFYPFGMKTKKKLSDFFTDLKIDLLEKQKIRLLCANNQIVWVIGYRADNRFRVDERTKSYYKIVLNKS